MIRSVIKRDQEKEKEKEKEGYGMKYGSILLVSNSRSLESLLPL